MVDLKKYISKKREINKIIATFKDTVVDDIIFFVKHTQLPLKDNLRGYVQMLENEYHREIFTFCENYWLEDFDLDSNEFAKMVLSCFVDCSIETGVFYEEEDDDFAQAEYGVTMDEYIASQLVDFLETQGLTKGDLDIHYNCLDSGCQYSIVIVKIKKEFVPFGSIAKYFNLVPTSQKDTYLTFIEDWQDGYCNSYSEFNLKKIKRVIKNAKLPIIKNNQALSKKYKKLKFVFCQNNNVDEIFKIMNTKTEVMF